MKFKLLSFHTNVHNSFHIFNGLAVPKTPLSLPAPFTNTVDSVCNELLFVSWGYVTCFTRPFSSLLPWTSIVRYSILCVWICSYFSNTCVMPLHTNYRHARLFLHSVYITLLSRDNIWSVSSVQSLSCVRLFATTWIAARQASLSITNSWSLLKLTSIESVMPSNHLILCCPLLLPLSIFPSIKVFSNESVLLIRWPKYWSFSISPSNECSGLTSLRMDWLDFFAVQGTLKSLPQYHSSKASILWCSAFFLVQFSHPYMTTRKSIDHMDLSWQSNISAFKYAA